MKERHRYLLAEEDTTHSVYKAVEHQPGSGFGDATLACQKTAAHLRLIRRASMAAIVQNSAFPKQARSDFLQKPRRKQKDGFHRIRATIKYRVGK